MLQERVAAELKQALQERDALRVSTLRLLAAAIHNREIEKRPRSGAPHSATLSDEEVVGVIRSELAKRREASQAYDRAGRPEAAARERAEAALLSAFLPPELSDGELERLVAEGAAAVGATSANDFGKLMGWVMGRARGRAAGERVAGAVRKRLSAA